MQLRESFDFAQFCIRADGQATRSFDVGVGGRLLGLRGQIRVCLSLRGLDATPSFDGAIKRGRGSHNASQLGIT